MLTWINPYILALLIFFFFQMSSRSADVFMAKCSFKVN